MIPLHASHEVTPGCAGEASVLVTALDGNPPYQYVWPDGVSTASRSNMLTGEYDVVITDATNCTHVYTVVIYNSDYEVEVQNVPCVGLLDGSIIVRIYNPNLESAQVLYNGAELPFDGDQIIEELVLGGIAPDEQIEFDVVVGDCVYEEMFEMESQQTTKVFSRSDSFVCFYDEHCGGDTIGLETYQTDVDFDSSRGEGGWLKECKIPYFCNGMEVGSQKIRKTSDKAWTYRHILDNARIQASFTDGDIDFLETDYDNSGVEPCDRVRYCPANLRIVSTNTAFNGEMNGSKRISENCVRVDCKFPRKDFDICVPDILPGYFSYDASGPGNPIICEMMTENLYLMYLWDFDLVLEFGEDYENSSLRSTILNTGFNPSAVCAYITFCRNSFFLINSTYNYDYDCSPFDGEPVCVIHPWAGHPGLSYSVCVGSCGPNQPPCLVTGILDLYYKGLDRSTSDETANLIIPEPFQFFSNWVQVVGSGIEYRKGIYSSGSTDHYYYDYKFRNSLTISEKIDITCHAVEDWNDDTFLFAECPVDNTSVISLQSPDQEWEKMLRAPSGLEIIELRQFENKYSLLIQSIGDLRLDENVLATSTTTALHQLSLSKNGAVLGITSSEYSTIEGESVLLDANGGYCRMYVNNATRDIEIDGVTKQLKSGERALVSLCDDANRFFSAIWLSPSMKMQDCAVSIDGQRTFLTLVGSGLIKINNQTVVNTDSKRAIVLTLDESGNYLSKSIFFATGIADDELKIATGQLGQQYIAFTLDEQRNFSGSTLTPVGGNDVVIAGLSDQGIWYDIQQYGSISDESVKDIRLGSDHIFIAGRAAKGVESRVIGDVELFSTNKELDFPYIVSKALPSQQSVTFSAVDEFEDYSALINEVHIMIRPSISIDVINLKVQSTANEELIQGYIFDSMGEIIMPLKVNDYLNNFKSIPISNLPTGVYIIQLTDKGGRSYSERFVKMN